MENTESEETNVTTTNLGLVVSNQQEMANPHEEGFSDNESWDWEPEHALLNNVILDYLFQFLNLKDLKSCRQVSKPWYENSLRFWFTKGPPIVMGGDKQKSSTSVLAFSSNREKYLSDFLREFHQGSLEINGIERYRKFDLRLLLRDQPLLGPFWKACGAWITQLKLTALTFPSSEFLQDVFECKYTPRLKELDLGVNVFNLFHKSSSEKFFEGRNNHLISLKLSGHLCPFPFDWKALLGHYTNLKNFAFGQSDLKDELLTILEAIKDIRNANKSQLQLESLSWFDVDIYWGATKRIPVYYPESYELLRDAELELKSFGADFSDFYYEDIEDIEDEDDEEYEEPMHGILTMYAESLKELSFFKDFPFRTSPFSEMSMVYLESLDISGYPFKNLSFLKDLPNLCSLTMRKNSKVRHPDSHYEAMILTLGNDIGKGLEFQSLLKFSCDYNYSWCPNDIIMLRRLMPNLTHLEMYLSNARFSQVCNYWRNLEHLCVFGARVRHHEFVDPWENSIVEPPRITNLQNLQSFVLENLKHDDDYVDGYEFTRYSVREGLMQLPRLERFAINAPYILNPDFEKYVLQRVPCAVINTWRYSRVSRP